MITKPYAVSVVYRDTTNHGSMSSTKTMLRMMHVDAVSEDEALGKALRLIPDKDRTVKNGLMVTYAVLEIQLEDNEENKKDSSSDQHADQSQQED